MALIQRTPNFLKYQCALENSFSGIIDSVPLTRIVGQLSCFVRGDSRMRSKHLAIIVVLGTVLASCHKRPVATVIPPAPTTVTVVVPVATPAAVPMDIPSSLPAPAGANVFEQAELAFVMGDYVAAIQGYENYLHLVPAGDHVDQALFHIGMAYVFQTQPPPNWKQATTSLR